MAVMRPFSDVDLHAFVDDQVNPERRAMIASYLKATPAEAARVESWRRQNDAIRAVFSGTATEAVPLWLTIGHVSAGRDRTAAPPQIRGHDGRAVDRATVSRRPQQSGGASWKLVALTVLAFAAGVGVPSLAPQWIEAVERWSPVSSRQESLHRLAERVAEAHVTYAMDVERPVEVVDSPAGFLAGWFRRHVAFPIRIPDLREAGWTLRGGRVVPGDLGPAALLIYQDAVGERLSLVTARVENPSPIDTSYQLLPNRALVWMDGPIGFAITASKDASWLSANARELYRAAYNEPAK